MRDSQTVGFINTQPLEARLGRLGAGVVDADVAFEYGVDHMRAYGCRFMRCSRSAKRGSERRGSNS